MSTLLLNSILRKIEPTAVITDLDAQSHFRTTVMPVQMASPQQLFDSFTELWERRQKPSALTLECRDIHALAGSSILYLIRGVRAFSRHHQVPILLANCPSSVGDVIDRVAVEDQIAVWFSDRQTLELSVRGVLPQHLGRALARLLDRKRTPCREQKNNSLYLKQLFQLGLLERSETIDFHHSSGRKRVILDYVIPPQFLVQSAQWNQPISHSRLSQPSLSIATNS